MFRAILLILSIVPVVIFYLPTALKELGVEDYVVENRNGYVIIDSLADEPPHDALTVAFLGNSHTFVNHVPVMLSKIGKCFNRTLWFRSSLVGGRTFSEHLEDGYSTQLVLSRTWDFVVLQPQSTEPLKAPERFGRDLGNLERLARQTNSGTILYCPWGRTIDDPYKLHERFSWAGRDFFDMSTRLNRSCLRYSSHSKVSRVGEAWKLSIQRNPSLKLHSPDGNHASVTGSYLAALTIYRAIDPTADLSKCGYAPDGISESSADFLRGVAQEF